MLTRKAVLGFASFCAMLERRCEARGEIEIPKGLPESSVRGWRIARAGVAEEGSAVVARARRVFLMTALSGVDFLNAETGRAALRGVVGARKSRYSCEVAAVRLYALAALGVTFAGLSVRAPTRLAARKHEVHMVDGDCIVVVSSIRI